MRSDTEMSEKCCDNGFSPGRQSIRVFAVFANRHTKVISQDGIADRNVACDALVEAPIGKDSKRCGQVLLSVQSLFLGRVEFRISTDLELLPAGRLAQRADRAVVFGVVIVYTDRGGHGGDDPGSE